MAAKKKAPPPKPAPPSEDVIERYLRKQMQAINGQCRKMAQVAETGFPDRLCLFPDGMLLFVELKAVGGKLSAAQKRVHAELFDVGHLVVVVNSKAQVDELLQRWQDTKEKAPPVEASSQVDGPDPSLPPPSVEDDF